MHRIESPQPMSNDAAIESAIKAVGADKAPRVTPADLAANIVSEHYFTAAEGIAGAARDGEAALEAAPPATTLLTFCVLVLRNGFTVTGESACASPENFNADIARQNAVAKIWPLMGYALKENLHNLANGPVHTPEWPEPSGKVLTDADALADLMGTPRPA